MKQTTKRRPTSLLRMVTSLVLAFSMLLSGVPVAFAAGGTLTTDGGAITWDLRDSTSPLYTDGVDGSLSVSGSISYNGAQHGANIGNDTVFTLSAPVGQTTITFSVCAYGSSTATVSAGGETLSTVTLNGADPDGAETSVRHTSDAATDITITISGNGYLHYIKAETVTPAVTAAVSGSVTGADADGQELLFQSEGETVETATISGGTYSVDLPTGKSYTVAFASADVYAVTEGGTIDLTAAEAGASVTNDIVCKMIWDTGKAFSFTLGGTTFAVTPGATAGADFSVAASGGDGSVELATADTAIIWADLNGAGRGTLTSSSLSGVSENVTPSVSGNTVTFTYTDTETSPAAYTVQVKDNSASGTPVADGSTTTYNFRDGSVVSQLYTADRPLSGGKTVSSTDGLLTLTANSRIRFNDTTHGIMIGSGDEISVKVAGNATVELTLCAYSAAGSTFSVSTGESVAAQGTTDGEAASYSYEGEAATLTFTYNGSGSGYLHTLSVTNQVPETEVVEQEAMPTVLTYGSPDALSVSNAGQTLILTQSGGGLPTGSALDSTVSYYAFPATTGLNKLEADVVLTACGNSSRNGVFFGAFDGSDLAAIGIRATTGLRAVNSRTDGTVGANSQVNTTITEGQTVHMTVEKTSTALVITATPEGGATQTFTCAYSSSSYPLVSANGANSELSFGFLMAGATAQVTNMVYTNADGKVLYDQNQAYTAIGAAPVVTSVTATGAETRDSITVTWNSSTLASGDGRYVLEVLQDGNWTKVTETTDTSYIYPISQGGIYQFRVYGKLGSTTNDPVESAVVDIMMALPTPELTLEAGADAITASWTAVEGAETYELYRYSSGAGAASAAAVYTGGETSYTDTGVSAEVPYYYYVIARSSDNWSNPSATLWAMATAGHDGDSAYDEGAAVITVDPIAETAFSSDLSIEGSVDRAGQLTLFFNGVEDITIDITEEENYTFAVAASLSEGSNEIVLLFTDAAGSQTRKTVSVVYLSSYDIVVDAAYTGTDGAAVDGCPTYSTVQAAVDSVSSSNASEQVIYIRSGDYEERLVVSAPNITLIGEDRESTLIHCYPAELYPDDTGYEAGGDMSKRCATYIKSTATNFRAENLSFANDYDYTTPDGKSNKSADALRCDADGARFVNVKVTGVQDSLYLDAGTQVFERSRIEGSVDFVYSGNNAKVLFQDCEIVFAAGTGRSGGIVCAPRTAADADCGLVFYRCAVIAEDGVSGDYKLARPWGPDGAVYWIKCYMGSVLNAEEPYSDMSGNSYLAARFFECATYGPGYLVSSDRRQISPDEANALLAIFGVGPDTSLTPTPEEPSDVTTGACGDSLTWILDAEGNLTISGAGEMYDYDFWNDGGVRPPWGTEIQSVTIEAGVTSIGAYAFCCTGLTSVTIPDGVTSIGMGAFDSCSDLASVSIPDSVTSIGDLAFQSCTSLTAIDIPQSVTSIGAFAFCCCSGLTSVTIPDSVTSIGDCAFIECTGLTSVVIPESVTAIPDECFFGCSSLTGVVLPSSVTAIGDDAFSNCTSLTAIAIPGSVTDIGYCAFSGCEKLSSVTISEGVTTIGWDAFEGCTSLTSVTIPKSVTQVGSCSFGFCAAETEDGYTHTLIEGFQIYGYRDTAAQDYAVDNGIPFIALDDTPDPEVVLTAPEQVSAKNSGNNIVVTWSEVEGAKSYNLYLSRDGGKTWRVLRSGLTGTRCVIGGGTSGGSYTYTVQAVAGEVTSDYGDAISTVIKLTVPGSISAKNSGNNIVVTWGAVRGAKSYNLYLSRDGGKSWRTLRRGLTSTRCVIGGGTSGGSYTYTVRAVNGSSISDYDHTGATVIKLAMPGSISAKNSGNNIVVTWGAVRGAKSYNLYLSRDGGKSWRTLRRGLTSTRCVIGGGTSGGSYTYTVRAVNGSSISDYDRSGATVIKLTMPGSISARNSGNNIVVTWGAVKGAKSYNLYLSRDGGKTWRTLRRGLTSTRCVIGGGTSGGRYTYTVRAVNGSSMSDCNRTGATVIKN